MNTTTRPSYSEPSVDQYYDYEQICVESTYSRVLFEKQFFFFLNEPTAFICGIRVRQSIQSAGSWNMVYISPMPCHVFQTLPSILCITPQNNL